ncbi:HTTM domain-containing protein [Streptomyces sp. SID5785]|uniref:HTTM domain-containing protein n=1 Tax=Streptomyces sp. SID5785 TaxID=2690309 RepID=UPI0013619E47|nr:HTTM domain-containing protein [Streptomyces sp. SID5785]MZD04002.1 HTTM domain-containing protein [Streptomyces sp. SID5785]
MSAASRTYAAGQQLAGALEKITASALAPYQSAVIRIGFATTWLLFLLREYPHRLELYGPDGPWSWDLAQQLVSDNHAFTALLWSDGRGWFELVYAAAVLSSLLLALGWRTRTMSVLFMIGVLSLQNRSVFVGDGGDNVIHLMSIYLVFTRCGQVWSLDARRAARARGGALRADRGGIVLWWVSGLALSAITFTGDVRGGWLLFLWSLWAVQGVWWALGRRAPHGEPRLLCDVIANLLHNAALLVIMVEACLIYATAGWYKIQGSRWQDGSAVYYPLHLDYFSPWPALGDLLTAYGPLVLLVTYGTVAVQVAFPFTVFNRRVKNVLLVLMIMEHVGIAVVLGLPFFSLAMITADAVFLPTPFLTWVGGRVARARGRLFPRTVLRREDPTAAEAPPEVPAPRTAEAQGATEAAGPAEAEGPAPDASGAPVTRT